MEEPNVCPHCENVISPYSSSHTCWLTPSQIEIALLRLERWRESKEAAFFAFIAERDPRRPAL